MDAKRGQIQFTGAIRTASLEPGTYTVVGMLPNFETRSPKQVEQRFLLIRADDWFVIANLDLRAQFCNILQWSIHSECP